MSDTDDTVVRGDRGVSTRGGSSAFVVVPVRMFLAAAWLRAGVEKVIEPNWWRSRELRSFVDAQHDSALSFYRPFLDEVVLPLAPVVAAFLALAQLAVGVAILTGWRIRPAIALGVIMNVSFVLAGVVNPSVFYLVMQGTLLLGLTPGSLTDLRVRPSRWSLAAGGASVVAAGALAPHIRSLEPDALIADPAAVLVLLCLVIAASVSVRWSGHLPFGLRRLVPEPEIVRAWVDARSGERGADARPVARPAPPAATETQTDHAVGWAPPVVERPVAPVVSQAVVAGSHRR